MVTGSHNPPEHNGFKVSFKTTIYGEEIQHLRKSSRTSDYHPAKAREEKIDILSPYVERYKKEFGTFRTSSGF